MDARKNFAISTVATAPSPAISGTSLDLAPGGGSKFDTPPFNLVVWPTGANPTSGNAEIIRVTAKSTDNLTIVRAQEGSSARTIVVGDQIMQAITDKTLTDIEDAVALKQPISVAVTCTTARTTATKVGTTVGGSYSPTLNDVILVTFTLGISVATPTLNIDGSGAKNIKVDTTNVSTTLLSTAASSVILKLWYDGTAWQLDGSHLNTDTTYTEITTAEIDAGTASTLRTFTGRRSQYIIDKITTAYNAAISAAIAALTKASVGLSNVDNTSDATKDAATASLTNKTIVTPKITTSLNDTNGNEIIKTPATVSAVNEVTVTNAATGTNPQISATGDDANIGLKAVAKGTGINQGFAAAKIGTISGASVLNTTGNKSITGLGFKPKIVRFTFILGNAASVNTGFGAMDAAGSQYAVTASDNGGSGAAYRSFATNRCSLTNSTGSSGIIQDLSYVSMDVDGFTINCNTAGSIDVIWEAYG